MTHCSELPEFIGNCYYLIIRESDKAEGSKYQAYAKQKASIERAIHEIGNMTTTIFNSILVHRIKDSHDALRQLCAKRLTSWMIAYPSYFYKDEYFKYLGWMTYDKASIVRKESIKCIGELLEVCRYQIQTHMLIYCVLY